MVIIKKWIENENRVLKLFSIPHSKGSVLSILISLLLIKKLIKKNKKAINKEKRRIKRIPII